MSETIEGKTVYIARHGESLSNIQKTIQDIPGALSPLGEIQAEQLAKRAANLDFKALISSDAERAVQTANTIAKRTQHVLETTPLLREVKSPTSLIGLSEASEKVKSFHTFLKQHMTDGMHQEDEESTLEVRNRAAEAIRFIEQHPAQSLFVVSHGMFLRMMTSVVMFGPDMDLALWPAINETFRTKNTGISIWRYQEGRWRIFSWNDHAHLG